MQALLGWRHQPHVVQTLRSTFAAVVAYVAALWLSGNPLPLTAPLTALLVVQVTLYATVTTSLRRVLSVVTGVLLAVGFAHFVGLRWWSLGILILACQVAGHLLRVYPWVPEVAISGMLVLGVVGAPETTALSRVIGTLIGAAIGVIVNLTIAPPIYLHPARQAIEDLGERLRDLLRRVGTELREGVSEQQTTGWLQDARQLDNEIRYVDERLSAVEESLRLNPRARRSPGTGRLLRTGLDTLEHCAVGLRGLCRSLADLSREEGRDPGPYGEQITSLLDHLLEALARAVDAFGRVVTAEATTNTAPAGSELTEAVEEARGDRTQLAELLLAETGEDPETWELHGTLMANVDRLMYELDPGRRSEQREAALHRPTTLRGAFRALAAGWLRRAVRKY